MTQRTKTAWFAGGGQAAGLRRDAGALASAHIIPDSAPHVKTEFPPSHLTPAEARLWAAAEAARGNGDRQEFWDLRREFLLEQSRRYPLAR